VCSVCGTNGIYRIFWRDHTLRTPTVAQLNLCGITAERMLGSWENEEAMVRANLMK